MRTRAPLLCLLLSACLMAAEPTASELYKRGRAAEKAGHMAQAYILYAEAAALAPKNHLYWLRAEAVKSRAALEAKPTPPKIGMPPHQFDVGLTELDIPSDPPPIPDATARDIAESKRMLPPSVLEAKGGDVIRDFDLRGDSKKLFEEMAKIYGLDAIFDGDYQPTGEIHFQLRQVDYRDAFHSLEAATGSFMIPLASKMFMVARDTPQKRTELEPTAAISIRLPEATSPQEFNSMITAVQQALALEKVAFDTQNNTVIIRDRVSKILPAQALFRDLLYPRAQVMIDMQIVEVTRNDMLTYGVQPPTLATLTPLTNWFNNPTNIMQNVAGLLKFGGGKTAFGIGIMMPQFVAQMSRGEGKVLLSAELRSVNGQPATFHVGNRYPILTAGYFGPGSTTGTTPGSTNRGAGSNLGTGTPNGNTNTGAGTLNLTQTSAAWTYNGGDLPPSATVTVTSTAGAIDVTATVASSSPWLTVNNLATASGTLPATLTISPAPGITSLGQGSYLGTVQISGADGSVTYFTVTLQVENGATGLSISPNPITLASGTSGLSAQQTVNVTSANGGTISATIVGPGLSLSVPSTTAAPNTPVTVAVIGNPTGLSAQVYSGILSVTVDGITAEAPVSFSVISSGSLQLSQNSVPWTYTTGGTLPQATNVTIASTSGATSFTATASSAGDWLLVNGVTSTVGGLPGTIVLSPAASVADLATGTYPAVVQLTASDGTIAYINVTLTVNGGTSAGVTVVPSPIALSAALNGGTVQQSVSVTSATAGTFAATVSGTGLSLASFNSTIEANVPTVLTVYGSPSGLAANTYIGSLTVTAAGVSQSIQITFSVGAINSGTNGITPYTPIPSFTFEDLGLLLKVTPVVHDMNEVSVDVDASYKVLSGQALNGMPILANRAVKSAVRLKMGEWAVVTGLLNTSDAHTIAGMAGLSRIPYLNTLTSTREHDKSTNQVLIIMRPRLITIPVNQMPVGTYYVGTETRPLTPLQ